MRTGRPRKLRLKKSTVRRRYSLAKRGMKAPKQRAAIRARNRVRRRKGR